MPAEPLRIVVDAVVPRRGSSLSIVMDHVLRAWASAGPGDELHLVLGPDTGIEVPAGAVVHESPGSRIGALDRQRAQNLRIPALCRELGADAMLASLPSTTVAPLPCPRVVIAYDLRHELLPHQFSRRSRALRRVSYGLAYRQAGAITCISDRTRQDLLRSRPWLRRRIVDVALLGSDHAATWPAPAGGGPPYAVAFGQYGNKNVDLVIDAWAELRERGAAMPLKLLGMPDDARATAGAHVARLGLTDLVEPLGWLDDEAHHAAVAGASMLVFPSSFEGFGLPAVEAMRLGIPVVVSQDPALLEVTDGHAAVMAGWTAADLADAVASIGAGAVDHGAARARAESLTWAGTAASIRSTITAAIEARGQDGRDG